MTVEPERGHLGPAPSQIQGPLPPTVSLHDIALFPPPPAAETGFPPCGNRASRPGHRALARSSLLRVLFVFFFWDPYDSNVVAFNIVLEVSEIVLISFTVVE